MRKNGVKEYLEILRYMREKEESKSNIDDSKISQ